MLFPDFSHKILEVLSRLVWDQKSCNPSFVVTKVSYSISKLRVYLLWPKWKYQDSGAMAETNIASSLHFYI